MPNTINNGNVVYSNGKLTQIIGTAEKTETIRIDSETVEDISYTFDLDLEQYVEQSRATRNESLPTPLPTTDEKIALLEEQNADLNLQIIDLFEQLLNKGVL